MAVAAGAHRRQDGLGDPERAQRVEPEEPVDLVERTVSSGARTVSPALLIRTSTSPASATARSTLS
ncbi:hypothetical protein [Amycolatopsis sp. NPDC098790]|uniref:hypothetical protein n=1 Tax=Amycolatopsis sp. NPDC098790 TaxID=3363939 RepID=UPI00380EA495